MTLAEWIKTKIDAGEAKGKKDAYRRLAETIKERAKGTGKDTISALTIEQAAGGYRIRTYGKAEAISEATLGEVTIKELCE